MVPLNSEIILVKNIKLDKDYVNVLSYNENQMLELCRQNMVNSASNYSFIRQNNNSIYTNFSYEECLQANYIAFQNKDYSNKWFFAFIDEVIYVGENNTELRYTIDSWSTWFDYWQKQPCFISRQHVNSDVIGEHTIPENIDVGEVIELNEVSQLSLGNDYYFCLMSSYNIINNEDFTGSEMINGNLVGYLTYVFESNGTAIVSLRKVLNEISLAGKIDSVLALFVAPSDLIDNIGKRSIDGYDGTYILDTDEIMSNEAIENSVNIDFDINKVYEYSDYTPKNNKCFVYPYYYLLGSNNVGNQNIYKFEDFYSNDGKIHFEIQLAFTVGVSGRIVPVNYKGCFKNIDESIPLAKYPTCSWSSDAFTNWLTQNAVNIGTQIVDTSIGLVSGNIPTVAGNIASLIGQFYQASLLPSITGGGQNTGDVNFSSKNNNIIFHIFRCKLEYLKIIDDYFSRFGYKINRVETPNIVGRRNWNYVEIGQSECIGYGTVPSSYMSEINNACRKGVTIWHNHSNLGNFNLDNSIT